MSLDAYRRVQARNQTPRQTEYAVFAQVTAAMMNAQKAEAKDLQDLVRIVHDNRRLWAALATDCADPDNALPNETRAGIISLSMFVTKYSSDVVRRGASIEPLIDINKTIMAGLAAVPAAAAS